MKFEKEGMALMLLNYLPDSYDNWLLLQCGGKKPYN